MISETVSEAEIKAALERVRYRIVRFRFNGSPRTIKRGLTLEQAQTHCRDPETRSQTCSSGKRGEGPWFDGYEVEQ